MQGSSWKLAALGLLSLLVIAGLTLRRTRVELLFFLSGPAPQAVQPIVEAGPAGLTVYFSLLGGDGRETRADGEAHLVVRDGRGVVYRESRRVGCEDFARVRLASPEGWRWALVSGFGWLGYHEHLSSPPAGAGQVEVTFTLGPGQTLRGTTTFTFPG